MILAVQIGIWVVGILTTLYVSGYLMFFDGMLDMIVSVSEILQDGATIDLAKTATLGFFRVWVASIVGWLIIMATGAIAYWAGEHKY